MLLHIHLILRDHRRRSGATGSTATGRVTGRVAVVGVSIKKTETGEGIPKLGRV
jgi:hypothetical protein